MWMRVSLIYAYPFQSGSGEYAADDESEKAQATADSINQSGGSALAVPGDVLDDQYIKDLVKKAAEFGGGKIHIIVNNAGYTWDGVIHKVRTCILNN